MILDYELWFSNAQALTGDAASTNVVDLKAAKDIGAGERLSVIARVTTTFDNLTSLNVILQGCTAADGTGATTLLTRNFLLAALTAGSELPMGSVPAGQSFRYLRMYYDVVGSDPAAGAITSYLSFDDRGQKAQNDAVRY